MKTKKKEESESEPQSQPAEPQNESELVNTLTASRLIALGNFSLLRSLPPRQRLYADSSNGTLSYDDRYLLALRRYNEGSSRMDVIEPIRKTFCVLRNDPVITADDRIACIDNVRSRFEEMYCTDAEFLHKLETVLFEASSETPPPVFDDNQSSPSNNQSSPFNNQFSPSNNQPSPQPSSPASLVRHRRTVTNDDFNVTDNPGDIFIQMNDDEKDNETNGLWRWLLYCWNRCIEKCAHWMQIIWQWLTKR
jgi:hypothetical protein